MSVVTTTKVAARHVGPKGTKAILEKVVSLLSEAEGYDTRVVDITIASHYERYGRSPSNKVDALVKIATD